MNSAAKSLATPGGRSLSLQQSHLHCKTRPDRDLLFSPMVTFKGALNSLDWRQMPQNLKASSASPLLPGKKKKHISHPPKQRPLKHTAKKTRFLPPLQAARSGPACSRMARLTVGKSSAKAQESTWCSQLSGVFPSSGITLKRKMIREARRLSGLSVPPKRKALALSGWCPN